jgi:hypothetical protein
MPSPATKKIDWPDLLFWVLAFIILGIILLFPPIRREEPAFDPANIDVEALQPPEIYIPEEPDRILRTPDLEEADDDEGAD